MLRALAAMFLLAFAFGAQAHKPMSCDLTAIFKQYEAMQDFTQRSISGGLGSNDRERMEFLLTEFERLSALTAASEKAHLAYIRCAEGR